MRTMGDVVREHAASNPGGTGDGIEMLDLHDCPPSVKNSAANLYIAALNIINEQTRVISDGANREKHLRGLLKESKAAFLGYPQAARNFTPTELVAAIREALK